MLKDELLDGVNACIFDLDGTLIDSMGLWGKIDAKFFSSHNIPLPDDYVEDISHMGFAEMAKYTKDRFKLKETPEEIAEIWTNMAISEYAHELHAKPHARELLKSLKERGMSIALATSSKAILYEPCLRNNDLWPYFDYAMNVNDIGTTKADPLIYQMLARKMYSDPKHTLVFEDILVAVKTAKSAGFRVVAVDDKFSNKDKDALIRTADYYMYDFFELM